MFIHRSKEPDGTHLAVQRVLTSINVRLPSLIFKTSWQLAEVPDDLKRAVLTQIFKKGKKELPGDLQDDQPNLSPEEDYRANIH